MTVEASTETRTCANCGAEVSAGARFCRSCGTPQQEAARAEQPGPAEDAAALTTPAAPAPLTPALEPGPPAPAPAAGGYRSADLASGDRPPASVEHGLLVRAKRGDRGAIETMFKQFLPPGEEIAAGEYLGVFGFWGFGRDSFGVVTDSRVAGLQVGSFGEVLYQDASLEYVNSTVLYQPSRSGLYITVGAISVVTFGIGLLLAPVIARAYYRRKKSGLVLVVREGVSVYVFIDRKRMLTANRFYREIARLREARIRRVGAT